MAMLAERKQKQKWTLNPRGKYWSEDANKFGQKMLEKMGWSAGKGLGAREDGMTEHVKQSYKNDTCGVGFQERGDQWTQHEADFSALLQGLGAGSQQGEAPPPAAPALPLERKSQSSRARVHYHKFTRGKDLTRYSEKDLANVFGRKTLEKKMEVPPEETETKNEDKDFGVMTIHGGNMSDYFKNKLKNFSLSKPDYESEDERPSFGFGYASNEVKTTETFVKDDTISCEIKEKTKEKKKKKTKVVINECFDNPAFSDFPSLPQHVAYDNPALDINSPQQQTIKKLKKPKLDTIQEISDEIKETSSAKYSDNADCENDIDRVKSKKKKKKNKADIDECPEELKTETGKSKKKNKHKSELQLETSENTTQNLEDELETSKKSMKNKKNKNSDAESLQSSTENQSLDHNEIISKKKKKVKDAVQEGDCEQNSEDMQQSEPPLRKKKKSKDVTLETTSQVHDEQTSELNICEKPKKKKRRNGENLDLDTENSSKADSYLDTQDENQQPKGKKRKNSFSGEPAKKKKKKGIDNPACTELDSGLDNPACTANSLQQNIEETIASMSNAIDDYQLELENKMNERKARQNDGWAPKFKSNRKFRDEKDKSVKQIIKESGRIRYNFEGSNLPEIPGYGVKI